MVLLTRKGNEYINERQQISSANTSVRKIPSVYNKYNFEKGSYILDWGCGKYYQDTIELMAKKGIIAAGYDPFNQSPAENALSLSLFENYFPDYIISSNVLNVIQEDNVIFRILDSMNAYADEHTKIIFNIYQCDKSGIGKVTSKGYQRNQKTKEYIPLIAEFFQIDKCSGDFIECSKL